MNNEGQGTWEVKEDQIEDEVPHEISRCQKSQSNPRKKKIILLEPEKKKTVDNESIPTTYKSPSTRIAAEARLKQCPVR